jgi:hypothetical protein
VDTKPRVSRQRHPVRLWRTYVTDVRITADAESDLYREVTPESKATRDMVVVLVTAALVLTIREFAGRDGAWLVTLLRWVGLGRVADGANAVFTTSPSAQFNALALWAVVQIAAYVIPPVLVIRYVLGGHLRDFGVRIRGSASHVWVYALLFGLSLPLIVSVSSTEPFLAKYSFYHLAPHEGLWPYLWAWWILYALQFAALEFFFRGFMVHGLKLRLGYAAIFVMMVPYAMLHFQKPILEALAAIVGATVLGTLSLKTRSVWWGAVLHISIAGTMDILALLHNGLL